MDRAERQYNKLSDVAPTIVNMQDRRKLESHLQSLLAKMRRQTNLMAGHANHGKRYTKADKATIKTMTIARESTEDIAKALGRTVKGVEQQRAKIIVETTPEHLSATQHTWNIPTEAAARALQAPQHYSSV
jgi:hypothetical protein